MIKGVNRQVLEIHETGCDYFEKALFFVKPEYSRENEGKLKTEAVSSAMNFTKIPKTRRQKIKSRVLIFAEMTASAGVGAIITALIIK
ncbi:MAG: hypothetical protein IJZ16_06815 [Clostridia bacterium]|nr:hypothetical protein [Clostridia bacterium]